MGLKSVIKRKKKKTYTILKRNCNQVKQIKKKKKEQHEHAQ